MEDRDIALIPSSSEEISVRSEQNKWENESLSQIQYKVLRGHKDGVNSCEFCNNDKLALTASDDGTAKLWDTLNMKLVNSFAAHTSRVSLARVSKDSQRFLTCSWDKNLNLWDMETGKILWTGRHTGIVTSCDISADGRVVVSTSDYDNALKLWNAENGKEIATIKDHHSSTPMCCMFSPNGERIATTGMDGIAKIWDRLSQKTTAKLNNHLNIVSSCAFSDNERYLCTASWDKTLRVWDISTGMYRSQGSSIFEKAHEGCVSCCRFSSDSQTLVSGGYDKAIVMWDMSTCSKNLALKGHDGWVTGIDISKDRKLILSSSKDKTVRIWNIENADSIPAVIENKYAMGLRIAQCENCKKPFSVAQLEDAIDFRFCVFCRLADPERNKLSLVF